MAVWSRGVCAALGLWFSGTALAGEHDMLALARLWSEVRATHPALADGRIDWDRALVAALPQVKGEDNQASLRAAAATLMAPLHDETLRIGAPTPHFVRWPADGDVLEWLPGDTALLHLHPGMRAGAAPFVLPARARRVILDLRPIAAVSYVSPDHLHGLLAQLIVQPLLPPAPRYRFSTGPRPQDLARWEGVLPGFMQMETQPLPPAPGARALPLAVIVNDAQPVPPAVLALQRMQGVRIVSEEGASRSRAGALQTVWLEQDLPVEFSAGQLVWPDGSAARWQADRRLPENRATGQGSPAVTAALALLARKPNRRPPIATPAMHAVRQDDAPYRDMRFPPPAWRQLAAIKLWATMDKYFPAKPLMDVSWDQALLDCLRRMDVVPDARAYGQALEAMAVQLDDSHVGTGSRALGWNERTHGVGVQLARIGGRIYVAGVTDPALEGSGSLRVGDEIISIDGEDAAARLLRLAGTVAASTEAGRWRKAMFEMTLAPANGVVKLVLAGADGKQRGVTVQPAVLDDRLPPRHALPVVSVEDGVAYVDLDRLQPGEVDAMFTAIKDSRALILDMRGYPNGTGRAIARRLNVNHATSFATSYQQLAMPYEAGHGAQLAYDDRLFPAPGPLYRGKVVMLIDEHTQSQAEHLALMVETATPVTFVGMPSAGANGDMREVVLPGNVHVWYSGLEVRHADGRRLQRLGVQPHVVAAPSVAGLRAGRDEVLERARQLLRQDQG
ncbi:S41 family peptidase [Janthinobacterium psychrotolerans]|uniref:C-terminal processing protease CtpA/Prc n=1 Tax=Janthinobacterium psychrotolerans TaxID=1747903 RepID=A0A1A7C760_9BURK|nr:S41 family peptidase [Janthinobacterium psychrotolerans]OBV41552.1 C-terminal processing protease CtpA/Prc [Janthinobacterium psychrotolerans]